MIGFKYWYAFGKREFVHHQRTSSIPNITFIEYSSMGGKFWMDNTKIMLKKK